MQWLQNVYFVKGEKYYQYAETFATQRAITLQECHVFDAIGSDDNVNESQPSNSSAANVSASSVNIRDAPIPIPVSVSVPILR